MRLASVTRVRHQRVRKKGRNCGKLGKWEHPVFDCSTALTAGCFVCFSEFWLPRPNPPVCLDQAGKRREGNRRPQPPTAKQCLSMSSVATDKGEQKAPQSRRGMQPPAQHPVVPIFILALPRSLSVEPRLHAHGKNVRHHSAGNTGTSGRQRSERTQHLQTDGKVRENRKCVDCTEGTVVPAWLLHPQSFFVASSTADDRVRMGPGYFQRLHQRQALHLVSGG